MLSEDSIWRWCQQEANRLDADQQAVISQSQKEEMPPAIFSSGVDIYDSQSKEFLALTDGICVPSQKPTREKAGQERKEKEAQRHDTDVFILPRKDGTEEFFCEGMTESWTCREAISAFLHREWSGCELSVVAITDGAKKIRSDLAALFGENVVVILDWYHLAKRVGEQLSMIASCMAQSLEWRQHILPFLWSGDVSSALTFLSGLSARRERAKVDLVGYLEKHRSEIIDYGRRQEAGKPIGSGRMEKGVDQVIGFRQKNRGMSWTKLGSRALALLTVAKLNTRRQACA